MPVKNSNKKPKKYFGTDGIRGRAGEGKLTRESIAKLGLAIGGYLYETRPGSDVVIARDTRQSGLWIENLIITGLIAHGINVRRLGVLPTAAASFLTEKMGASLGMMITASHNPAHDNGIKFFEPDGTKFANATQKNIEARLASKLDLPKTAQMGKTFEEPEAGDPYLSTVVSSVSKGVDFSNLSVVLDCANGAGVKTGPAILDYLGIKSVIVLGDNPDGRNINRDCGSTHPDQLCAAVKEHGADIGIALDGDADRLIMCDERGEVINGDQTMGALALNWRKNDRLAKPGLVATVMSNLGLERLMEKEGLSFVRTPVGDRHVADAMQRQGYNLGGEQSGHMLMPDFMPTGDGMMAAVQVLSVLVESRQPASQALRVFDPAPQTLVNVRYSGESPVGSEAVQAAVAKAETEFGNAGRVLIRASGTEPVIRIMTEGDDPKLVASLASYIADAVKAQSN